MAHVSTVFFAAYLRVLIAAMGDRMVTPEAANKLLELAEQTQNVWLSLAEIPDQETQP